jgi:hypothetical protein
VPARQQDAAVIWLSWGHTRRIEMDVRDKCGSAGRADVGGFGEFGVALLAELVHCFRVHRLE